MRPDDDLIDEILINLERTQVGKNEKSRKLWRDIYARDAAVALAELDTDPEHDPDHIRILERMRDKEWPDAA